MSVYPGGYPRRRWGFFRHLLVFFFVFYPVWFWVVGTDFTAPLVVYIGLVLLVRFVRALWR